MGSYPTLKSFLGSLGSERECQWLLCRVRWPDGDRCPRCGSPEIRLVISGLTGKRRDSILHRCLGCDYHFSETAGTIFHDTRLDIRDWFLAIYLMGSTEKGIRPAQLETYLGISHETARNMVRRIRSAIQQDKHFLQRYVRLPKRGSGNIEPPVANRSRHFTLHAIVHKFATEERAREHWTRIHWPNGPTCPKCKKPDVRKVQSKYQCDWPLYRCLLCKKQFSATSGTFFHGIRRVSEWLIAIYLMESSPRGVPPKQLQRLLGLSYRTAVSLLEVFRGREDIRKRAFKIYIGYNGPAELKQLKEAQKEHPVPNEKKLHE
ncbi:MAG: ISXo5 transposase [Bryobacterales bacterium]|jgi:transposase-like protein|nr:ISXo5 transposase [Bryobacterales bacterium]